MKRIKCLLIIGCLSLMGLFFIIGCLKQPSTDLTSIEHKIIEETSHVDLEGDIEKERLFQFANSILEETFKGKVALVDHQMDLISQDGHDRYFVKVEGVGINEQQKVDIYHYYMILQRTTQDELYMMPFGLEVLKGEVDKIEEDILISMLKLTNGWEMSQEEVLDKWRNNMEGEYYNNLKQVTLDINNLYYLQSLMCFVNEYIYTNEEEAFLKIGGEHVKRDLLDFTIREIKNKDMQEENTVIVTGKLRVYGTEWIKDYLIEMSYKIAMDEKGRFHIVGQDGIIQ
ncbi:MAG: hypothetical protein RR090_01480 [Niameybacter sp.]|uniref:hypothetical protein n=1 Tax=Niameybacter sp. TaxID=2033640 RepID=UPI002FCBAA61